MTRSGRPALRAACATAAVLGIVSLTGCGGGDGKAAPARTSSPTTSASPSATPSATGSAAPGGVASTDSLVDAAALVIDAVPSSTLTSIASAPRGWRVTVAGPAGVASDAVVNRRGTKIVSAPATQDGTGTARRARARLVAGATVDYAVAVREIARQAPGALTEVRLGDYRDRVVWAGDDDSRPTVSVRIDAGDGRVLSPASAR